MASHICGVRPFPFALWLYLGFYLKLGGWRARGGSHLINSGGDLALLIWGKGEASRLGLYGTPIDTKDSFSLAIACFHVMSCKVVDAVMLWVACPPCLATFAREAAQRVDRVQP